MTDMGGGEGGLVWRASPFTRGEEERSGVMPIHELYLLQPGVQPSQITLYHHQYYGAVSNARADHSGARSSCSALSWGCHFLTNQVLDLHKYSFAHTV
jgi:hypothetical protein